jgi:hypothetical protein
MGNNEDIEEYDNSKYMNILSISRFVLKIIGG